MNSAQLINQDSGDFEYYTPIEIVDMAREVMGIISLDPFSSHKANKRVRASTVMDIHDNGLIKPWFGAVWMNHPFGRKTNKPCIDKLISEFEKGNIKQACCITFAATSEAWFRPLLAYPQCFIHGRTNYYLPDGTKKKDVTKGSVVTYLGDNTERFKEVFSKIGTVK
jgi:ParB family chromosome partitioning protein